jgi:uncharacterized protein YdeI (YjbR/CyaY-like superfamily)
MKRLKAFCSRLARGNFFQPTAIRSGLVPVHLINVENLRSFFIFGSMPKKDPRIDAYIARAADFAKPILQRVRKLIHAACPQVEETMKWSSPFFLHRGILIATPAFKQHCRLIFWKGRLFLGKERRKFGRLTSLADLPADKILRGYIKKAVELNETGIKNPARKKTKPKKTVVPEDFLAALRKNKKALVAFEKFSPSCRREYVEWIIEARREETRAKRIKTAIQWIATGKSRNWKYE